MCRGIGEAAGAQAMLIPESGGSHVGVSPDAHSGRQTCAFESLSCCVIAELEKVQKFK